jgi:hypothetical protein
VSDKLSQYLECTLFMFIYLFIHTSHFKMFVLMVLQMNSETVEMLHGLFIEQNDAHIYGLGLLS